MENIEKERYKKFLKDFGFDPQEILGIRNMNEKKDRGNYIRKVSKLYERTMNLSEIIFKSESSSDDAREIAKLASYISKIILEKEKIKNPGFQKFYEYYCCFEFVLTEIHGFYLELTFDNEENGGSTKFKTHNEKLIFRFEKSYNDVETAKLFKEEEKDFECRKKFEEKYCFEEIEDRSKKNDMVFKSAKTSIYHYRKFLNYECFSNEDRKNMTPKIYIERANKFIKENSQNVKSDGSGFVYEELKVNEKLKVKYSAVVNGKPEPHNILTFFIKA
jgi:hypothetical protein